MYVFALDFRRNLIRRFELGVDVVFLLIWCDVVLSPATLEVGVLEESKHEVGYLHYIVRGSNVPYLILMVESANFLNRIRDSIFSTLTFEILRTQHNQSVWINYGVFVGMTKPWSICNISIFLEYYCIFGRSSTVYDF